MTAAALPRPSPTRDLVTGVMAVICTLIFAAFISVMIEWVGMWFIWPEQGINHSRRMLSDQIGYLNQDFKDAVMGFSPIAFVAGCIHAVQTSPYIALTQAWILRLQESAWTQWAGLSAAVILHMFEAAINTLSVFFIRLVILCLSLPRLVLYTLLAVVYGLSLRDIRRISGGREYGYRYHRIKPYVFWSFGLFIISYLSFPESVHPNWLLLPLAVAYPAGVLFLIATFKKYF